MTTLVYCPNGSSFSTTLCKQGRKVLWCLAFIRDLSFPSTHPSCPCNLLRAAIYYLPFLLRTRIYYFWLAYRMEKTSSARLSPEGGGSWWEGGAGSEAGSREADALLDGRLAVPPTRPWTRVCARTAARPPRPPPPPPHFRLPHPRLVLQRTLDNLTISLLSARARYTRLLLLKIIGGWRMGEERRSVIFLLCPKRWQ